MVDINFDDWIKSERRSILELESRIGAEKDAEYSHTLKSINSVLGTNYESFDSFDEIDSETIINKIESLADAINNDPIPLAGLYAVDSLFMNRSDLEYYDLEKVFLALNPTRITKVDIRNTIANNLIEKIDEHCAKSYLELLTSFMPEDFADRGILILGIPKISKEFRADALAILKQQLISRQGTDSVVTVARKIKATELLPELKEILPTIANRDIYSRANQTIKELEASLAKQQ